MRLSTRDLRPPGTAPGPTITVTLVGCDYLATVLAGHLPDGCRIEPVDRLDQTTATDVLVVGAATPATVAAAVRRHPSIPVVGLIDAAAPVTTIVGVLEAGADTCVRAGETVLIASHLLACLRRRAVSAGSQPTPSFRPAPSQPGPPALRP